MHVVVEGVREDRVAPNVRRRLVLVLGRQLLDRQGLGSWAVHPAAATIDLFLRRGADTEVGSSKSKWQRKQRAQDNGAGQARNRGHAETYQRSGVVVATSPWYLLRPARERGRSSASTAGTRVERGAETHWPRPTPVTDACSPDARCAFEWMLRHAPHRPSAVHFGHLAVRKHARHERSRPQALHAPR